MKRYLIFAGNDYEAMGGWDDLLGTSSSLQAAKKRARACLYLKAGYYPHRGDNEWSHVVDVLTGKMLFSYSVKYGKIVEREEAPGEVSKAQKINKENVRIFGDDYTYTHPVHVNCPCILLPKPTVDGEEDNEH